MMPVVFCVAPAVAFRVTIPTPPFTAPFRVMALLAPLAVKLTPLPDTEPVPATVRPPVFVIETSPAVLCTLPVTVSPLATASFTVKPPPAVNPKLPPRLAMALASPRVTVPPVLPSSVSAVIRPLLVWLIPPLAPSIAPPVPVFKFSAMEISPPASISKF